MKNRFYYKPNRAIEAHSDPKVNERANTILKFMESKLDVLGIPEEFRVNWKDVSLYHPKGDVEKANSLLLDPVKGAYDLNNKINHLTGKEWIKFTCSWFIFNAIKEDIKQEKALDSNSDEHPATYSPTMVADFIKFFTKEGDNVFDPFMGIGSTAEACKRTKRVAYGTELNTKYHSIAIRRDQSFESNIFNCDATLVNTLDIPTIDFSISSPPYWDILNRSTKDFKKTRDGKNQDVKYSDSDEDIGNISDYRQFIRACAQIYFNLYEKLKKGAYIVIIIKNVKKDGVFYPLAWDLAKELTAKYELKDEKLWIQDKIGLAPYGYPFSWTSNILHHYCLILRK
jgi:DNA modification methylase